MIKICDKTVALPLKIIFDAGLESCRYPDKWKEKTLSLCIKKKVKIFLRIIDQYRYYLSAGKYLKSVFIANSLFLS